ncbi:MAG: DUF1127 domain-containing protein [Rhodobacteraceae bacterium]|jgi:uncharacterized protein YjiS (DUF1127 family)|nr:DUF1127 domain-containing protein [Paracoccaceae bacterium]
MTYATASSTVKLSRPASSGLFANLGAALARRRLYSRTLYELRQLTDRELADLGISRLSLTDVAREAAYGK